MVKLLAAIVNVKVQKWKISFWMAFKFHTISNVAQKHLLNEYLVLLKLLAKTRFLAHSEKQSQFGLGNLKCWISHFDTILRTELIFNEFRF